MQKKHLYSFNKGILIGLEILGVTILMIALLWFALLVKLSRGPLDVDYLTSTIEKTLNTQELGYKFDVDKTVLIWGGAGNRRMELEMRNVRVFRQDDTPVFAVKKIGIQLAKKYLLIGKIVPRVVKIYGPALRVVRSADNSFSLNLNEDQQQDSANVPATPQLGNEEELLQSLLQMMKEGGSAVLSVGLEKISVNEASILYEDNVLNVNWKSKKANLTFTKKDGGIAIESIASLEKDEKSNAYIKGSIFYSWNIAKTNGIIYFTGVNLAKFAQESGQLQSLRSIDADFKGSLAFELDDKLKLIYSRFVVGADSGHYNVADVYEKPVKIDSIFTEGKYDNSSKELVLEKLEVKFDEVTALVTGKVNESKDGKIIVINGEIENMPIDYLSDYWPHALAQDARKWVVGNLSKGKANKATINSILLLDNTPEHRLHLVDVKGDMDYEGMEVDYFNPLKKVTDVVGTAYYDNKSFNLDISSGTLEDMKVVSSKIRIYDLDIQDDDTNSHIDISVSLDGPLQTALKVLDDKPLEYPKGLGLKAENFTGNTLINANFQFPLYDGLKVEEVKVKVDADAKNIVAKKILKDLDLTADAAKVSVTNGEMKVVGSGSLGEMKVTFEWLNSFDKTSEYESIIKADASAGVKELRAFGMPENMDVTGIMPVKVDYKENWQGAEKVSLRGDLSAASLSLPYINYRKSASIPGYIDLDMSYDGKGGVRRVSSLKYESQENEVLGAFDIDKAKGDLLSAKFSKVKAGNNDFTYEVKRENGFYVLKINGKALDVSEILSDRKQKNGTDDIDQATTPLVADVSVGSLYTSEGRNIFDAKVYLRTDEWERLNQLEVDATAGEQPLSMRYMPQLKGGYSFEFKALNAGAALSALDVTNSVKGGTLELKGYPDLQNGKRDIAGTVRLSKFTLTDIPVLGMLLNSMSLSGMMELLNGKGISFNNMTAKFWWVDKGKPDYFEKIRHIKIKDGQTSGASLGLTFDGNIDMLAKFINMEGTIIPVSGVSKFVGSIPLVGDILTGGNGGGIIAATYKIKGSTKNPDASVNPLSVLAPGLIRKIFFE